MFYVILETWKVLLKRKELHLITDFQALSLSLPYTFFFKFLCGKISLILFPSCSLSQYSDENMMDSGNLAICFGPTLMPTPDLLDQVSCQAHVNEIIKTIIIHHEAIFPDTKELEGPVYEKCMSSTEYWWEFSK